MPTPLPALPRRLRRAAVAALGWLLLALAAAPAAYAAADERAGEGQRAGTVFLPSAGVSPELAADLTEVLAAGLERGGAAEVMAKERFDLLLAAAGTGDAAACARDAACARSAGRQAGLDFVVVAEATGSAGGFQLTLTRYSVPVDIVRVQRFDLDEKLAQLAMSLESAREDLLRPDGALLQVSVDVPEATVLLDGVLLGTTPLAPREIVPGAHELAVRRDGWLPASAAIRCEPAAPCPVELTLRREPAVSAAPPPSEPPAALPERSEPQPDAPPERGMSVQQILAWTSVGVAVAAGATGTAFAVRTGQLQDEIDSKCDGGARTCTFDRDRARSLQDDGELSATLTNVFYGVAGAAAVAAVVLFLTEPDDEPARVEVLPQATADGVGVGALVRF